ncbi:hypothetical protein TMatcc_009615 [Talaromyces marneffei ATCC 18224]
MYYDLMTGAEDFLLFFANPLLFLLLFLLTTLGGLSLLAANTTRATATEGRGESEVDVLLGVKADHVGGDVDDLLSNTVVLLVYSLRSSKEWFHVPDVTLADQDTGVVDGLGETELVDTGLETTLQEILNLQGQDVIELHAGLVEHTDTNETANEGISFEETLGVLLVKNIPSGTTNLGKSELDTPDLTLVAETVLADSLQFGVTIEDMLGMDNTT